MEHRTCESWARAGVPTDKLLAAFSPPFIPRTLHRVPVGTACIPTYHSVTQTVFCRILVLSFLFVLGILMQILGCTLYSNWWPMLTLFFYVLIPMPHLFFGAAPADSFYSSGVEVGWMEAGKFLTGFSAVGLVAVPAILMHANYITVGAMLIEICAAASIGAMVAVYDYASQESMY